MACVIKFTKPFRGSSIAPQIRQHAQLGDLNGRHYLQSQHPMLPSFYGANNQTLIVAPDATVRRLVESAGQATSGPIIDRVESVPGGNDLYAAVDIESIRPLAQAGNWPRRPRKFRLTLSRFSKFRTWSRRPN